MKVISAECARSDRKHENCEMDDCGCRCHVIKRLRWQKTLEDLSRKEKKLNGLG